MKKIITLLFVIIMLTVFSMVVSAETMPVRDVAYFETYGDIYVLLENNTLLFGDTIDTPNPQVISTNVKQIIPCYSYLILLHNDGTIDKLNYFSYQGNHMVVNNTVDYSVNANAIDIIGSKSDFLYIDNSNALYKYNEYKKESILLFENVKICKNIPNRDEALVITLDNKLYYINYAKTTDIQTRLVLGNVVDVMANDKYCVFYRTNKELYSFSYYQFSGDQYLIPLRISTEVDSFDDVILNEEYCYYMLEDTVYRYRCDMGESLGEFATNVDKIQLLSEGVYIIHNDKSVYAGKYRYLAGTYDIKQFLTTKDFYLSVNGDLYKNSTSSNTTKASKYNRYFSDVERIIVGKGSNFDKVYLFITNNGELYCSIGNVYNLGDPFLTSFCEKRTKVIINDKEVELETRIQIVNNRSMYPFRECLENMGALVMWDSTNRIAIGELNGITVEFPIDKNYYYINGEIHYMDTTSYISNGRTYIPIRFAAEALGFTVEWESTAVENKISIFE